LPAGILRGRKPSDIIDEAGGWRIDKVDNLGTGNAFGEAVCFVSPAFAAAAVAAVDTCVALSEAEVQTFLDDKHFSQVTAEKRDAGVLESLKAERDLHVDRAESTTAIDIKIGKALDPDDPEPGVRRVQTSTSFAEEKTKRNIRVVAPSP
jgi:hypothetical protein